MRAAALDERLHPTLNLCVNPRATAIGIVDGYQILTDKWGGTGAVVTRQWVTGAADGPDGVTSYRRATWTTPPAGGAADVGGTILRQIGGAQVREQAVAGLMIGFTLALRFSIATAPTLLRPRLRFYTSPADGTLAAPTVFGDDRAGRYLPGAWLVFELEHRITPAEAGTFPQLDVEANFSAGAIQAGDTRDVTRGHVGTTATYLDGDQPGARWLGNRHASASVGYPPVDNTLLLPDTPPPELRS